MKWSYAGRYSKGDKVRTNCNLNYREYKFFGEPGRKTFQKDTTGYISSVNISTAMTDSLQLATYDINLMDGDFLVDVPEIYLEKVD